MKLLVLLFLVGYAAASAGDGLDRTAEGVVQDLLGDSSSLIQRAEEDQDIKTELGKKLQEHLDRILEKIKDAMDHGKTIKEETIEKLKEIKEKLKDMKIDMGEKAKELLNKIKEKAKDFLQKILDRLGLKDDKDAQAQAAVFMRSVGRMIQNSEDEEDVKEEMGKKLRERIDEILEKIKDAIKQGKTVREEVIEKLKKFMENLKEHNIDIGERAKELMKKIKERAKDFFKNLLDKLGLKDKRSTEVSRAEGKIRDFFKKLKKSLLDTIDKEKLKEKIENMFGKGNEFAKNLIDLLTEKGKKKLLELVDRILGDDKERETW